jgi:hypothetical protein
VYIYGIVRCLASSIYNEAIYPFFHKKISNMMGMISVKIAVPMIHAFKYATGNKGM